MSTEKHPAELAAALREQAAQVKGDDHFNKKKRELLLARAEKLEAAARVAGTQPASPPRPATTPSPTPEDTEVGGGEGGGDAAGEPTPAGSRPSCSYCRQPGHNARTCPERAVGKKPARPAAAKTIRGMGPPSAPPPLIIGTATAPGDLLVGDRKIAVRPGDTGEVLAARVVAAAAGPGATTIVQDGPEPASDEVAEPATPVAENPAAPTEVVSLDPFRAAGAAVIERLREPVPSRRRPPELTAEEEAAARAEINRTVDAAAAALGNLIDRIPEASAEDLATEEALAAPARPPFFRFMLPAVAPAAEPPTPGTLALRVRELERYLAERDRTIDGLNNRVQELGRERDAAQARLRELESENDERAADQATTAKTLRVFGDRVRELEELAAHAAAAPAGPALPPLTPGQHLEIYCGPPRAPRVERLEQGIAAALLALKAAGPCPDKADITLFRDLLLDCLTKPLTTP